MPAPTVCPRHPGTSTRLSCVRCDAPVCPACMVPAATGHVCPDCAGGARRDRVRARPRTADRRAPATTALLVLLALAAVATAAQGGMALSGGMFSGATPLHHELGMFGPAVAVGQWHRLVTSALLHYGPVHLAMNAYGLVLLGPPLEARLGSGRMAGLLVVSALFASAGSALVEPFGLAAGASGALFGLLGAAVVLERRRGVTRLLESSVGLWLVMGLVMTFAVPGLSVGGHLGGVVGGAIVGTTLFELERREERVLGVLAVLALGLLAVGVAVVGSSAAVASIGGP